MTDINNKEIIFGKRPVRRTNRKPGQSEWYYLDPRCAETFSDMKQIDVENEYSPNPYANEIQNYLYNNDEYNYKLLYGDNPPQTLNSNPSDSIQYIKSIKPITDLSTGNSSNIDYSLYGKGFSKEFIDEMLDNSDYQKALNEYVIPNEKGYVNDIRDPGKETNMGITKRYYPNEDIKNLTRERANAILYKDIWNWNGINKLPREIKGFVFDHGVRTSPQNAIETTHKALGINPVGDIIGNTTLNLLQYIDYEEFLRRYQNLVREQDRNNKNYQYFGKGWNNRTNGYHVSY